MSSVLFEKQGPVGIITLNRPEVRNAINHEMALLIEEHIDSIENDSGLRAGVIRATTLEPRPVFCAGHDLSRIESEMAGDGTVETERGGFAGLVRLTRTKPLIAAVDGLATSGGLEIVLACDLVLATARSAFALAEARWGLVAGAGGLFRLPWIVGRAVAMQIALTGEPIDAERAYQLGLVNELVEGEVAEAAIAWARRISGNGATALAQSMRVVNGAFMGTLADQWSTSESAYAAVVAAPDIAVGLAAFRERPRSR